MHRKNCLQKQDIIERNTSYLNSSPLALLLRLTLLVSLTAVRIRVSLPLQPGLGCGHRVGTATAARTLLLSGTATRRLDSGQYESHGLSLGRRLHLHVVILVLHVLGGLGWRNGNLPGS